MRVSLVGLGTVVSSGWRVAAMKKAASPWRLGRVFGLSAIRPNDPPPAPGASVRQNTKSRCRRRRSSPRLYRRGSPMSRLKGPRSRLRISRPGRRRYPRRRRLGARVRRNIRGETAPGGSKRPLGPSPRPGGQAAATGPGARTAVGSSGRRIVEPQALDRQCRASDMGSIRSDSERGTSDRQSHARDFGLH